MNLDPNELDSVMSVAARPPLVFVEGCGSFIIDHRGKRYLDFVQGWAVNALGHSPPQITQALVEQSARLINPSPAFFNAPALALSRRLAQLSGFERVFLCSTGAEANEGAIKLARKWGAQHKGGAFEIITFEGAFHGRTLATMSASGKAGFERLFEPKVPGFFKARVNDLDSVRARIGGKTVAVMLEPVQGEAGVVPFEADFVQALRVLCDEHGVLLIFDEVQTGIGRTGALFAFEPIGVRPDIVTLGKGIGGGVPLAALLAREEVAAAFAHGDQGGTYTGHALMTAVGLAVVNTVAQPAFLREVCTQGEHLRAHLAALAADIGGAERGRGMLRALVLPRPYAAQVVEATRALEPMGLLLNAPRPDVLRFMPALNVSGEEIDTMRALLAPVLRSCG
jgi:acetylornithine/N-succinyldiaminopimelate aminotransferase